MSMNILKATEPRMYHPPDHPRPLVNSHDTFGCIYAFPIYKKTHSQESSIHDHAQVTSEDDNTTARDWGEDVKTANDYEHYQNVFIEMLG